MISYVIILFIFLLVVTYFTVLRQCHLRWGASNNEIDLQLPGDSIVVLPHFNATRAITINSDPSTIWKWIIQIGSNRAGWYSYDWIDNGGVRSSNEILPHLQIIELDQFIPFTPNQKNGMWVKEFQPFEYILWWDKKGHGTWGWYLNPVGQSKTRLITRLRTKYDFRLPWIFYYILYDFGDIIMMKKCMRGIKERAEVNFSKL